MILDSNILIGYLNGDGSIRDSLHIWRESGKLLFISQISIIELLSFSFLTQEQIEITKHFLHEFIIISLTEESALQAATLRRTHHLTLADAIILAAAELNNLPLVTRDKKLQKVARMPISI